MSEQAALEGIIPTDLKASSVWEVESQISPIDIESEDMKPATASQAFETKPIGVTSQQDSLLGTEYMEELKQPEQKSGKLLIYENQQPLEVTNVQITETSSELIEKLQSSLRHLPMKHQILLRIPSKWR